MFSVSKGTVSSLFDLESSRSFIQELQLRWLHNGPRVCLIHGKNFIINYTNNPWQNFETFITFFCIVCLQKKSCTVFLIVLIFVMPPTVSEGGIVFCLQFYRKNQRCVSLHLCRGCIRQPWGEPKGAITEMLWHYAVVPIQFWGSSIKGNFYWQVFKGC